MDWNGLILDDLGYPYFRKPPIRLWSTNWERSHHPARWKGQPNRPRIGEGAEAEFRQPLNRTKNLGVCLLPHHQRWPIWAYVRQMGWRDLHRATCAQVQRATGISRESVKTAGVVWIVCEKADSARVQLIACNSQNDVKISHKFPPHIPRYP